MCLVLFFCIFVLLLFQRAMTYVLSGSNKIEPIRTDDLVIYPCILSAVFFFFLVI